MRVTFRAKLIAVAAVAALALALLFLGAQLIAQRTEKQIVGIQQRYLPKIGLRPQLEAQFERLRRGLQDAVGANDLELLEATRATKRAFLETLAGANGAVEPSSSAALVEALEDYYLTAFGISRRLIAGETGEQLVDGMTTMQAKQAHAEKLLDEATRFDRAELAQAFAAVIEAQRVDARNRLLMSTACLALVVGLAFWINRGLLRSLRGLTAGLQRFGAGDFATQISVGSHDELGDVAEQANQMARSLERVVWLKASGVGLSNELRGELSPREVADRATAFLSRTLGAPVAALYTRGSDGVWQLTGGHAITREAAPFFLDGEGLLGQAALTTEITVIDAPPKGTLRLRSGLVEHDVQTLVLLPLLHLGKVAGILELALVGLWTERAEELLLSVRETISIAIEVARARAATTELLEETRRQRQALQDANRELDDAGRRLEQKAEELQSASAYKSQFLANMSHELRTPLNAIIGFSELIYDGQVGLDAPQAKEFVGDILTSGRHLLQLINDVLDLSKVEAGKIEFHPERTEMRAVVDEVLAILRSTSAARRVRIEAEIDDQLGPLFLDPARLKQVLYNYASNAIKFSHEGGVVQVRARADGEHGLLLEVEDRGVGIAEADLGRLWHEFQQIHREGTPRAGGTGLGLALTKRLIQAQGGTVGVRSVAGEGSVFWARLPRRVAALRPAVAPPAPVIREGAPAVLVIEDNPADQADLVAALAGAGYSVEVAATGAEALARWRERRFDAITLDLLLPDMTGLEVLRQIREASTEVPVIVISVVTEPGAVAGCAVHDVLSKPLSAERLLASLVSAGVAPHRAGSVLVVDDDVGSQRLMAATLRQLGYEPHCEPDGVRALAAFNASPSSAIVLDLSMPQMDGFEFLARLRLSPNGRRVPVIVWTVKDLTPEEHRLLRASAQAVVPKGQGGAVLVMSELLAFLPRGSSPD